MSFSSILLINALAILIVTFVFWLISVFMRDVGIVDIFWGLGFVMVAWLSALFSGNTTWHGWVLVGMVTVWGTRLGGYLAMRNLGKPEDSRYQAMRDKMGHERFWWMSLFIVFWLQGAIMWLVALPIQAGLSAAPEFQWLCLLAAVAWGVGFFFEAVGDYQLASFKAKPENKGQVLDQGLWRYTRHPNYFGDFLVWWGLYGWVALAGAAWWTVFSPVIMTVLLMKVSGVTLLEKSIGDRRPAYAEYKRRTNAFFPAPPKPAQGSSSAASQSPTT